MDQVLEIALEGQKIGVAYNGRLRGCRCASELGDHHDRDGKK